MLTFTELVSLSHLLHDQHVLSVYLDGTSENPASRRAWRVQLENSLKDLRRWLEGSSHDERAAFEHCVELLDGELARFQGAVGSPGWAAFITANDVRGAEGLPAPTPTLAVWSTGICMTPYMRVLKQTRTVVVLVADARKVRVYRYAAGVLQPAQTLHAHAVTEAPSHMGDAPRLGFHAGTRGTTGRDAAQHALQAGRDRMIAEVTRRSVELAGDDGWILAGGVPEVSAQIAGALERIAPHRVLLLDSLDIHATDAQVTTAAQQGASQLRDQMDLRHVLEIIGDAENEGTVARRPAETRRALEHGRVRALYFTSRYAEDHLAEAEEAVRAAISQGALVEEVSRAVARRLDEFGGMGARLRYALPQSEVVESPVTTDGNQEMEAGDS
jgi:hypothetical protein